MYKLLTVAGSDCSGGAGVQADLKTFTANKVYGMSIITSLTAQNTVGVTKIEELPEDFLKAQFDAVFTDIVPDATKIGMVSNINNVMVISEKLRQYEAKNIVVDPVMVTTSNVMLIDSEAVRALENYLFPMATIITPNIPEAEKLSGAVIRSISDMEKVGQILYNKYNFMGTQGVLIKGGHLDSNVAVDVLWTKEGNYNIPIKKLNNNNIHGTGCTLSSAIATHLAKGCSLREAVERGKEYVYQCISRMLDLGRGSGPLQHFE